MILTPLQKLPKNVRDLGKLIVAKGFENLSKFQLFAQSGHTATVPLILGKFSQKFLFLLFLWWGNFSASYQNQFQVKSGIF